MWWWKYMTNWKISYDKFLPFGFQWSKRVRISFLKKSTMLRFEPGPQKAKVQKSPLAIYRNIGTLIQTYKSRNIYLYIIMTYIQKRTSIPMYGLAACQP